MAPGPSFPPIVSWKLGCKNTLAQSSPCRNAMARTSLFKRGRAAMDTRKFNRAMRIGSGEGRTGRVHLHGEAPGPGRL